MRRLRPARVTTLGLKVIQSWASEWEIGCQVQSCLIACREEGALGSLRLGSLGAAQAVAQAWGPWKQGESQCGVSWGLGWWHAWGEGVPWAGLQKLDV